MLEIRVISGESVEIDDPLPEMSHFRGAQGTIVTKLPFKAYILLKNGEHELFFDEEYSTITKILERKRVSDEACYDFLKGKGKD